MLPEDALPCSVDPDGGVTSVRVPDEANAAPKSSSNSSLKWVVGPVSDVVVLALPEPPAVTSMIGVVFAPPMLSIQPSAFWPVSHENANELPSVPSMTRVATYHAGTVPLEAVRYWNVQPDGAYPLAGA
jgi:hypothetical protein